jgi:hypothetical protein
VNEADLTAWCEELLQNSNIVQDGDDSVAQAEVERSFNRFVELVDMTQGDEPPQVFQALIDSIRVPDDYGAYEAVHNALWNFPPERFAENTACFFYPLPE